jgi:predicted enzyme related to lactoylglutathione lyase
MKKTLDKATSLGGSIVMPAMEVEGQSGLKIAQFKDPDDNGIGIMKLPAMSWRNVGRWGSGR